MECVYLIRDKQSGLHKIGMTKNWERRSKELKVGSITAKVRIVPCRNSEKWEKVLHAMFKQKRLLLLRNLERSYAISNPMGRFSANFISLITKVLISNKNLLN